MRFFSDLADTVVTHNRLPHWEQEAATYFVTWRLKDSIPKELSDEWRHDRNEWVRLHPSPLTAEEEAEFHRLFSTRMDLLMDAGYGECVLRGPECREILATSLGMFDGERFLMHLWVAMPNHVHVLFPSRRTGRLRRRWEGGRGILRWGSIRFWGRKARFGRRIISTG